MLAMIASNSWLASDLADLRAYLDALSVQDWAFLAVVYGGGTVAALWAFKNVSVFCLRQLGLSHPGQYRWFPRLPWRTVLKLWLILKAWRERVFRFGKQSSGGFSGALATLTNLYAPGKILIGRAYGFGLPFLQPLGVKVARHIKVFAMTGAGKTTLFISIINCWMGSGLIVDPKGQITEALAAKDKKRTRFVFDPLGITEFSCAHFNVFDVIKWAVERGGPDVAVLWAQRIAECLITTPSGAKQPYFYDISRGFVTGLILHVLTTYPEDNHNLPFVRTLILAGEKVINPDTGEEETEKDETFPFLLDCMQNNHAYDGIVIGAAKALETAGKETLGNILSTLLEQTKWLDVPAIRRVLLRSDFSLADLKTRNDVALSLVAPVLSVREELRDCFRLILNISAYIFEAEQQKNGQCLFVVDELPSLGYNPVFEVIVPVARSQGITFCGISQDIEILKKAYPQSWESFIGNADIVIWMGSNHEATLQYLSGVLGYRTLVEKDRRTGRKNYRQVRVAEADQLRRFLDPNGERIIITRAGKRAIKAVNEPYYKALPVTHYAPDPDHREPFLRRLMRRLIALFTEQKTKAKTDLNTPQPTAMEADNE